MSSDALEAPQWAHVAAMRAPSREHEPPLRELPAWDAWRGSVLLPLPSPNRESNARLQLVCSFRSSVGARSCAASRGRRDICAASLASKTLDATLGRLSTRPPPVRDICFHPAESNMVALKAAEPAVGCEPLLVLWIGSAARPHSSVQQQGPHRGDACSLRATVQPIPRAG